MKVDLCDIKRMLRSEFFSKDRDIYMASNRHVYLNDGTDIDDVVDAQYVTMTASADLDNERVLTAGTAISVTDGGAGGNATLDHTQVAAGDLHTEYTQEAVLTAIGSMYAASAASTPAERTVGADGEVLIADSTDPTGVSWSSAPNGWVPIGGIILWAQGSGYLPANWQVCDGTNSTPDLRDKFVVGAGSSYSVGDTGGDDEVDISHTHGPGTLNTDSDTHDHDITGNTAYESSHTHASGSYATDSPGSGTDPTLDGSGTPALSPTRFDAHTHDVTGTSASGSQHRHSAGGLSNDNDTHDHDVDSGETASGGDTTHDNRPQFYAVYYIQRIS